MKTQRFVGGHIGPSGAGVPKGRTVGFEEVTASLVLAWC